MNIEDIPVTAAVRFLRDHNIPFVPHRYSYEERGGTRRAAEQLNLDEHAVIKTLVMEEDPRHPLLVLMHGDCEVSTKQLARALGVKQITPSSPATAQRHTGFIVGGISPFGTKAELPVCVEATIFDLPRIYINGGKRGFLVELDPSSLRYLPCIDVHVAIPS